ncbi:MAG: discoidin domain-containing protein [Methylohalobius sp.]|nr:discoidin domain-containing protein [Methylohalobius sp.]
MKVLDDFTALSWGAVASVRATLDLSLTATPRGRALRLDFAFQSRYGFVVARRPLQLELPPSYAFCFLIRGEGGLCGFEFKLADAQGNVWRYRQEGFVLVRDFQELWIASTQIEFAWGPRGESCPQAVTAVEVAFTAASPGKNWAEIADMRLHDCTYRGVPQVLASSALPGCDPNHVLTSDATAWRSDPAEPQWLMLDFGRERFLGGLVIAWEEGKEALAFEVQRSDDGIDWHDVYATHQGGARCSYVYLPNTCARFLRLSLLRSRLGQGFGIGRLDVKPPEFSRSLDAFFAAVAREHPPGWFPKYWQGWQSYWTSFGVPEGGMKALISEEGVIEVGEGGFSLEPFLYFDGRFFTWREAEIAQSLEQSYLPAPRVEWRVGGIFLNITALGQTEGLYLCYRLQNSLKESKTIHLFAAIQPCQVTPPWQKWRRFGGVFAIQSLQLSSGQILINGELRVTPLTPASGFGAVAFTQGPIGQYLSQGVLPWQLKVEDPLGLASGALRFDLELAPGEAREVWLMTGTRGVVPDRERAVFIWRKALSIPHSQLPPPAQEMWKCLKTCAAHILLHRQGAALRPGPRRYQRAWIRDGVGMGIALLRLGLNEPLRDFLAWYAEFQTEDGRLPDCVDEEGPEWLPEWDAYGQFLHALAEYRRMSDDDGWVSTMWPQAKKAVAYLEGLRAQRLTPEYQLPDKRLYYGLLPESMSHEGYMAQPMHALWDNFWALRGLRDAAFLARSLGEAAEDARLEAVAMEFKRDIGLAVSAACARHGIEYVPGSIELGDFDPSAVAIACALGVEDCVPNSLLRGTFDRYLEELKKRISGNFPWINYSPYEVRIVQALVRLGRRAEALALLSFLLADRRPAAWNQWPEIAWRDAQAPCFLGDLPHSWIGAEYILAVLSLFAYETEDKLVLAAGVAEDWLAQGQIAICGLPTRYGRLSYSLRREGAHNLRLAVEGGIRVPSGGVVVELPRPIAYLEGEAMASERFITLWQLPQEIKIRLRA